MGCYKFCRSSFRFVEFCCCNLVFAEIFVWISAGLSGLVVQCQVLFFILRFLLFLDFELLRFSLSTGSVIESRA